MDSVAVSLFKSVACTPRVYPNIPPQLMPAEGSLHDRTWMAYGATISAWGRGTSTPEARDFSNSRPVARHDLIRIAAQMSRFEPVNMLVATEAERVEAEGWLSTVTSQTSVLDQITKSATIDASGRIYIGPNRKESSLPPIRKHPINFIVQPINDLWARDTAPVFVKDVKGVVSGVNFNFNGWGQEQSEACLPNWVKGKKDGVMDQDIEADVNVAGFINKWLKVPEVSTWLTMEGGGIEVNGRGLAVAAESCILNTNRNPGKTKAEVENELKRVLGVEKLIWIPGKKGGDITDGHIDFNVRFTTANRLVYSFDAVDDIDSIKAFNEGVIAINALSPDLKAKYLGSPTAVLVATSLPIADIARVKEAIDVRNPDPKITTRRNFDSFANGYIGLYEVNGAVLMSQFGDVAADQKAFDLIQTEFPEKVVIQITIDGVANGGGSIHCTTQQQMIPNNSKTIRFAYCVTFLLTLVGMIHIY